jgi:hypothetical protein
VVYADTDSVVVEDVTDDADAFVPREAGEELLAVCLPAVTADRADSIAELGDMVTRLEGT